MSPAGRRCSKNETPESVRGLVDNHAHTVLAAPRAHCEGVLGNRRTDFEPASRFEARVRTAHSLQRSRLGAELFRATQVEDGAFRHDRLETTGAARGGDARQQNTCGPVAKGRAGC
jgi:hypothetical protein